MTSVGEALVLALAARGVTTVFGIPGVHTVELYRGLPASGIRHVTARHEQGAAFMADGYARVSGRPGVAFVITGPGLTNALTAMAQARADSVPMLVISGVNRRDSLGRGLGHLHELPDQAALVAALCPTFRVNSPTDLAPMLDAAFAALTTGRPGPVHLDIPTDVMPLPCPVPPPPVAHQPAPPDIAALADIAALLNAASRPVILAGGGARHAAPALRAIAQRLDAPVIQTVNARGTMWGSPLSVALSPSLDATRALIADADQIFAIGTEIGPTDYDMYQRGGLPDLSAMIRIDICPQQLRRHPAARTLASDAATALTALLPLIRQKQAQATSRATAARAAAATEIAALAPAMPAQIACVHAIRNACPAAIIVGDSTQPVYAANLSYDHDRPGGWFNAATGYGALGFAPGAAVGAAIAAPGTAVICLIGDGGLQFSPGELRTARDENLPITFIVWNNAAFQEIADSMAAVGAPVIGCDPSPLRLEPFAAACDLPFTSIPPDPARLHHALTTPLPGGPRSGPRLIEIRLVAPPLP